MRSNRKLLRLFDLPVFSSLEDLCEQAHLDASRVRTIALEPFRFYRRYTIPKKCGGVRWIYQPTAEVKAIQSWILRNILERLKASSAAMAFVKGVSLDMNAKPHSSNRYFLCLDLEDFFPSIRDFQVTELFLAIGYSRDAATWLTRLCTLHSKLPQGAVTSPSLSNLACLRFDRRLMGLAATKGIVYTRYADDLTFSSNNPTILRRSMAVIMRIIHSEGYYLNGAKTRFSGPDVCCEVTGLIKDSSTPRFGMGRQRYRMLRAEIHRLVGGKVPENYSSDASLRGMLAFVKGVDETAFKALTRYWNQLVAKRMADPKGGGANT